MNCQEKLRNDSASHRTYLNGIVLVEDWGSRAGKVVDLINLHKQRLGDI
jgi:hypothetical protein